MCVKAYEFYKTTLFSKTRSIGNLLFKVLVSLSFLLKNSLSLKVEGALLSVH